MVVSVDDVVLWASVSNDLQVTVGGLQAAVMGISTAESKSMVHREKEVDYPQWVGNDKWRTSKHHVTS